MKNKILILLLALLSVIVFASCSQNETNTNINTNTNTDTSTDTDTDTAIEYIIESADGFTIDTTEQMVKLYRDISNETENIDISKAITVSKNCTWKLYKDFEGNNELKLKSMSLNIGLNKAYIIVYHPNGEDFTRYEVNLYRLDMKSYSFVVEGAWSSNGRTEEKSSINAPTEIPQKTGYSFDCWTVNGKQVEFPYQVKEKTIFNARWTPITYQIKYELNGGENNEENPNSYNIEQSLVFKAPTRVGYTFAGWFSDEELKNEATAIPLGSTEDKTFYAKWTPNRNTLIFNANGGSGSLPNMTIATNASANLINNVLTKVGYTFVGWSTSEDGEVEYIDGASYTMGTDATYTLYAVWKANANTLVFNANGGSGSMPNMTIETNASANLINNAFTRTGYTFLGWSTTKDGKAEYMDGASYTMGKKATYTLYAVWKANANTLVFNANSGSGSMLDMTITTDASANLTSNAFTKAGYAFKGWSTTKDGSVEYANGAEYTMGTDATYTLYAVWEIIDYSITYVLNGGVNGENSNKYTIEQEIILENPTKVGYAFDGWYSDSEFNNNVTKIPLGSTEDKTFYAKWTPNNNTLIFDANGGSGSMPNITLATDASVNLTNNTLTRYSYTFKGWSTTKDGSVEYADGAEYTMGTDATYTLYAVWEINEYTITYYKNGGTEKAENPVKFTIEDLPITLNALNNKTNYLFNYWYKESDFTGSPVNQIVDIGDITLYAEYVECTDGISLTDTNGNWAVSSYAGTATDVVIPKSYKGKDVTMVESDAFRNCTSLTSVTIGNGVTSIGKYAFRDCTSLTSIVVPDSITSIGSYAFYNCTSLTSIVIPNGVVTIESSVFYNCSSLTSIKIPNNITTIGSYAFYNCNSLTSIEIPKRVTTIGSDAFYYCRGLTSIEIPSSVTSIGSDAFSGCSSLASVNYLGTLEQWYNISYATDDANPLYYAKNLYINDELVTSLVIPNTVTEIKPYVFAGCTSLTSVTIPSSVTGVGSGAFWGCKGLTNVNYLGTVEQWCNIKFGHNACLLYYTKNLYINNELVTSLVIPNTVTAIKAYAFYGYKGLTSIEIPNSVTSIENHVFCGCENLLNIVIPNSVTSIGNYAFSGCTGLTSVVVPGSVTSIGEYTFYDCTGLTSVTIENGVTSIGDNMFESCKGLTSVKIPDSVTSIGDSAFENCTSLTSVVVPDSVTSIGGFTFYGCTGLTSVTIENGVTGVGSYAFSGCTSLTSVTIPGSVTSIGNGAFSGCTGLTSVVVPDGVTTIGEYAFSGCKGLTSVVVPNSVTSIGNHAFYDCTSLTSIIIPDSVTSIGDYAFWYCTSLTIYCEAESKPSGWNSNWNYSNRPVEWGYKQS